MLHLSVISRIHESHFRFTVKSKVVTNDWILPGMNINIGQRVSCHGDLARFQTEPTNLALNFVAHPSDSESNSTRCPKDQTWSVSTEMLTYCMLQATVW